MKISCWIVIKRYISSLSYLRYDFTALHLPNGTEESYHQVLSDRSIQIANVSEIQQEVNLKENESLSTNFTVVHCYNMGSKII